MRRIAVVNQKGGVGKTTTTVNLGAALANRGRRVLLIDLDPQANLSMHLGIEVPSGETSIYDVLLGEAPFGDAIRPTEVPGLSVVPANIDLSGAEMELAGALGREALLQDAIQNWVAENEGLAVDYLLIDCPPSLGLLSINGLVAASEVFIALQTEFFALQGMSKLVKVVQLLRNRLNPELAITGILASLHDNRRRLAREVLAEIRQYFPGQVFRRAIATNVKLAEAPSYGQTIFQYAPSSSGARDYGLLAEEILAQEAAGTQPLAFEAENAASGDSSPDEAAVVELQPVDPASAERLQRLPRAADLPPLPPEVFRHPRS